MHYILNQISMSNSLIFVIIVGDYPVIYSGKFNQKGLNFFLRIMEYTSAHMHREELMLSSWYKPHEMGPIINSVDINCLVCLRMYADCDKLYVSSYYTSAWILLLMVFCGLQFVVLVFSVLVVGARVFRGFQQNNWVLASLVGLGITCVSRVILFRQF